jgi:hypothetical protein
VAKHNKKSPSAELGLKSKAMRKQRSYPEQGRRQEFVFTTWEKQLERARNKCKALVLRVPKKRLEERNNFSTVWNNSVVQNVAELRHNALVEP